MTWEASVYVALTFTVEILRFISSCRVDCLHASPSETQDWHVVLGASKWTAFALKCIISYSTNHGAHLRITTWGRCNNHSFSPYQHPFIMLLLLVSSFSLALRMQLPGFISSIADPSFPQRWTGNPAWMSKWLSVTPRWLWHNWDGAPSGKAFSRKSQEWPGVIMVVLKCWWCL